MSVIFNNICETCDNQSICSAWKNIKKFSEDYSKNPLPVDIEIKNCDKHISSDMENTGDENNDFDTELPEEMDI